ncbi:MAG: PEGA domain-containing protein [Chitinophagaceae bacterium]|nr:MAG: PEGA domain-containing protein [Chitinophagaceae bacterium]
MKPASLLLLLIALALAPGCATIVHGPLQKFVITSDPRVAAVYVDGRPYGKTPAVIRMTRKKNHKLVLTLPGYEPYELLLKRKLDHWLFGNILVGAVPGIAIDLLTGSIYRLTPGDIYPTLRASDALTSSDAVVINVTLQPSEDWALIGVMKKMPE